MIQKATPETIVQFHDQLSNELPTLKGKWSFSFKIFRNNPYSIAPELAETSVTSSESKFLYTLAPSYLVGSCISLINKNSACVFSNVIEEESGEILNASEFSIPDSHLHQGATTGLNDTFDFFVNQKMQSLWTQKQNIKGDGGQIYELENGSLIIRTSNVFLHGIFKGLLIQIEVETESGEHETNSLLEPFERVLSKYNIPRGKMSCNVLDSKLLDKYGDLCLQYSEILNF